MAEELNALFETIKAELKIAGKRYKDVAAALHLSEPTVKTMLSTQNLRVDRLERICARVLGYDMAELYRRMENRVVKVSALTKEQELHLANNPELFAVAVCVLNNWSIAEIVETYQIELNECHSHLHELEKLNLVAVQQNQTRIRLLIDKNFDWLPDGPIVRFFERYVGPEFLNAHFDQEGEKRVFKTGMLSKASMDELEKRIDKLIDGFLQLNEGDSRLQIGHRVGTSLFVATRPYELKAFTELRRKK